MEIGFAKSNDVDGWLELLESVKDNFPGLDLDEYKKGLSKRILEQGALVAKESDRVMGALLFSRESKELEFLAVHRRYRELGIATALIEQMFMLFPPGSQVTVVTYRENDEKGQAARKLYERIGFAPGRLVTVFDYPCQEFTYTTK